MAGAQTLSATAAAAVVEQREELAAAKEQVARLQGQRREEEMLAEELATTRKAKLGMVARLQDTWSERAAQCTTRSAKPTRGDGSPLHLVTQKLGQVCIQIQ
jgi:hypothetical protein